MKNVLSIQSWVAFGHVGNASAMFPLPRLGVEVWAVNTVQFSNHTGYGKWRGAVFTGDMVREIVTGIDERGVLGSCDGVLSGYMGDAGIGEAILEAVAKVKAANPSALYCCDPVIGAVIGDVGRGVFVRPGIPEFMREHAVPAADLITPNQFELELLAGRRIVGLDDLNAALDTAHALGPSVVLVTSVQLADTPADRIDMVASDGRSRWRVRTPMLPLSINGAGDAVAALFFVHFARGGDAKLALGAAAASIFGLLRRTAEAGSREILTVAAQDEFVAPSTRFEVETLGR